MNDALCISFSIILFFKGVCENTRVWPVNAKSVGIVARPKRPRQATHLPLRAMARTGGINPEVFGPWGFRSRDAHIERTEHLIHIPSKFGSFYIGLHSYYATRVEAISLMRVVNRMLGEVKGISPTRTAAI